MSRHHAVGCHGTNRLARALTCLVITLAVFSALAPPHAHAAGSPTWLPAQRIEPGQHQITGLSCASGTMCAAATSTLPVVSDGGPAFEPPSNPDGNGSPLNAVSCAPGTRFCMFVDANGGAFTYDSGTFGGFTDFDGSTELSSVSCTSSTFCMAIDHNAKVFKYTSGNWDAGTQLTTGGSTVHVISCATTSFCIAVATTSSGQVSFTYNGSTWSSASPAFDSLGGNVVSLTCTSSIFCMATDATGNAVRSNGSSWGIPVAVDSGTGVATPILYSSCAGTACVAIDSLDNVAQFDGSVWSSTTNIHAATLIGTVAAVACASAALCVAGDGGGNATTFAVSPSPGTPTVTGSATVGQTLTLTHASVATAPVWYADNWRRCDQPGASCTNAISTSTSSYQLQDADGGKYVDVQETFGFGFDLEGPIGSNIVGVVHPVPTATNLGSSTNPSTVGQQVTLTATVSPIPDGGTVAFSDGGTALSGCDAQTVNTSTGKATCPATFTASGTHSVTASYGGDSNFKASASSALSQVVNVAATAPTAANDSYATATNRAVSIAAPGVLGNDSAPNGDPLSGAVVGNPAHGTLALNPGGDFTYTPATGFAGTDSFTYRATDTATAADSNVATVTITVDATAPSLSVTSPAAAVQVTPTISFCFSASDSETGVATYDVRYRTASWNGTFGAYQYPASWQHTAARCESLTASPGHQYCFSARARNGVDASSAWTAQTWCRALPLDDRALAAVTAGWHRGKGTRYYRSTVTSAATGGQSLRLRNAHVHRLALIVTKCPTCGSLSVIVNGTTYKVSTTAKSTRYRVVVLLPVVRLQVATVLIRSTSKHAVYVDGLAVLQA